MTEDEIMLEDVAIAGPRGRAPNTPTERDQFIRLMAAGYLQRVHIRSDAGDTGDQLVCAITERGRQRLAEGR